MTGEGDLQGTSLLPAHLALSFIFVLMCGWTQLTHKFPARWTLGSALFLASFAAVMGPLNYAQHLFSGPRLPFTGAYFGSIVLTLYFAMGVSHLPSLSTGCEGHSAVFAETWLTLVY